MIVVFTDAHVKNEEDLRRVLSFLEEKENSDVYFLGDMFDDPDDYWRYRDVFQSYTFTWVRGNHDPDEELPLYVESGDLLLTHGHKWLVTGPIEDIFIRCTPLAKRTGLYRFFLSIGPAAERTPLRDVVARALVWLTEALRPPVRPLLMGHLHTYLRGKMVTVIPPFPYYAEVEGGLITLKIYRR